MPVYITIRDVLDGGSEDVTAKKVEVFMLDGVDKLGLVHKLW